MGASAWQRRFQTLNGAKDSAPPLRRPVTLRNTRRASQNTLLRIHNTPGASRNTGGASCNTVGAYSNGGKASWNTPEAYSQYGRSVLLDGPGVFPGTVWGKSRRESRQGREEGEGIGVTSSERPSSSARRAKVTPSVPASGSSSGRGGKSDRGG